jgi:hypothetical protein
MSDQTEEPAYTVEVRLTQGDRVLGTISVTGGAPWRGVPAMVRAKGFFDVQKPDGLAGFFDAVAQDIRRAKEQA